MKLLVVLLLALPSSPEDPARLDAGGGRLGHPHGTIRRGLPQPPALSSRRVASVHESIYIDAGEWLYHVSRAVGTREWPTCARAIRSK